jgi:hypothetical protein
MENIFEKFLGKCWFIYRRPEMAGIILRQICEDARAYMRRVISYECALVDLCQRELSRSKSMPNLEHPVKGNLKTNWCEKYFMDLEPKLVPIRSW